MDLQLKPEIQQGNDIAAMISSPTIKLILLGSEHDQSSYSCRRIGNADQ